MSSPDEGATIQGLTRVLPVGRLNSNGSGSSAKARSMKENVGKQDQMYFE
jgi:hypothetical protein